MLILQGFNKGRNLPLFAWKGRFINGYEKHKLGIASTPLDNRCICCRAGLKFSLRDRAVLHGSEQERDESEFRLALTLVQKGPQTTTAHYPHY